VRNNIEMGLCAIACCAFIAATPQAALATGGAPATITLGAGAAPTVAPNPAALNEQVTFRFEVTITGDPLIGGELDFTATGTIVAVDLPEGWGETFPGSRIFVRNYDGTFITFDRFQAVVTARFTECADGSVTIDGSATSSTGGSVEAEAFSLNVAVQCDLCAGATLTVNAPTLSPPVPRAGVSTLLSYTATLTKPATGDTAFEVVSFDPGDVDAVVNSIAVSPVIGGDGLTPSVTIEVNVTYPECGNKPTALAVRTVFNDDCTLNATRTATLAVACEVCDPSTLTVAGGAVSPDPPPIRTTVMLQFLISLTKPAGTGTTFEILSFNPGAGGTPLDTPFITGVMNPDSTNPTAEACALVEYATVGSKTASLSVRATFNGACTRIETGRRMFSTTPLLEFIDLDGRVLSDDKGIISVVQPDVFRSIANWNAPAGTFIAEWALGIKPRGPVSMSSREEREPAPAEPTGASFRVRVLDPSEAGDTLDVIVTGETGGAPNQSVELVCRRQSGTSVFLSEKRVYAVADASLTAVEQAAFPDAVFIDPEGTKGQLKKANVVEKNAKTYQVYLGYRADGFSERLADDVKPEPVSVKDSPGLYCVIKVGTQYYRQPNTVPVPKGTVLPKTYDGNELLEWDDATLGTPTITWRNIVPDPRALSFRNTIEPGKPKNTVKYHELRYQDPAPAAGSGWSFEPPRTPGATYWSVEVQVRKPNGFQLAVPLRTPGPEARRVVKQADDPADKAINVDKVQRVVQEIDSNDPFIRAASRWIGLPRIDFASPFHQVSPLIGADGPALVVVAKGAAVIDASFMVSAEAIARNPTAKVKDKRLPGVDVAGLRPLGDQERSALKPGDILVIGHDEAREHEVVIYLDTRTAGKLDGSESILFAEHVPFRVGRVRLGRLAEVNPKIDIKKAVLAAVRY
jgi:hypothetical protein